MVVDGRVVPHSLVDGPLDPDPVGRDRDQVRRAADGDQRGQRPGCTCGLDIGTNTAAVPLGPVDIEEETGCVAVSAVVQQVHAGGVGKQG